MTLLYVVWLWGLVANLPIIAFEKSFWAMAVKMLKVECDRKKRIFIAMGIEKVYGTTIIFQSVSTKR